MTRTKAVLTLALTTTILAACEAERNESGEIATAGSVDAFAIRVGDCFNDEILESDEVFDVRGVPCAEPHDNEVYATFDMTESSFPGEERAYEIGDEGCLERFEGYVGATYDESVLMYYPMVPTEGSWSQRKDREIVCVTYHMELEKLKGTVRKTGM